MWILSIAGLGITAVYGLIQLWFVRGWMKAPQHSSTETNGPLRWSILIPARDEADKIGDCLAAVFAQRADFEVLVIDDHSSDNTAQQAAAAGAKVLVLPKGEEGKKAALNTGIAAATGDWIVTLDADAIPESTWLASLATYTKGNVAVAGPVMLYPLRSILDRFQALDFCGMMAITAASIQHGKFAMGNGANLAFAKSSFQAVEGYELPEGKSAVSGDDMVLLGKLLTHFPGKIAFAKTPAAVVRTSSQSTLSAFVLQRWRWAAKTGLNLQPELTLILGLTYFFHVFLVLGWLLVMLGHIALQLYVVAWLIKLLVDAILLRKATSFFARKVLLGWDYPFLSVLHALYVAGIGSLALLPFSFSWKGRKAKN